MTRGILVSAPRSGGGKTVVTLGLMRALARRGLRVAGAKNGPDYIDPAFHSAATGRASLNLDSWAMAPDLVRALASRAADDADLLICEGSMGLFDGVGAPPGRGGSSAEVAKALGVPVVLVLDVSGQAQTSVIAALGCRNYDPDLSIGGVILNRVASDRHRELASEGLAVHGIPILGALPRSDGLTLPERHLGLVQAGEHGDLDAKLDAIAAFIEAHVDVEAVAALARPVRTEAQTWRAPPVPPPGQRVAVARDDAFSFVYPHVLDGWRSVGADIVFFSPLADQPPPDDSDCCWLPGGYPELHASRLAAASRFLDGLARFATTRPVHGECGGYMVLGEILIDKDGIGHRMAGLLPGRFNFAKRAMKLGYREGTLVADCILGPEGAMLRGHEFHYATATEEGAGVAPFVMMRDARGGAFEPAGGRRGLVSGSFLHIVAMQT